MNLQHTIADVDRRQLADAHRRAENYRAERDNTLHLLATQTSLANRLAHEHRQAFAEIDELRATITQLRAELADAHDRITELETP